MVWLPTERPEVEKEPPVPMEPSRLEVQAREEVRSPSSASLEEPVKVTLVPSVDETTLE